MLTTATTLMVLSRSCRSVASFVPSVARNGHHHRHRHRVVLHRPFAARTTNDDDDGVVATTTTTTDTLVNAVVPSLRRESDPDVNAGGYARPTINWYPGHIAKAESLLAETLKAVDIVLEVRDARAPKATAHPRVAEWSGGRPRIVVLTKTDLIPKVNVNAWKRWSEATGGVFEGWVSHNTNSATKEQRNRAEQALNERNKYRNDNDKVDDNADVARKVEDMLFVDAKRGQGIHALHRAIWKAGQHVNERRNRRGLADRALRVGVIGYPNVGKSALINRILGRRRARSANTPGVTRSLQWIRVRSTAATSAGRSKEFELLDSPGIIPANMRNSRTDAALLAVCNSVGDAAYDNQAAAAFLIDWINTLRDAMGRERDAAPEFRETFAARYGFDPAEKATTDRGDERTLTGEETLFRVADEKCRGDAEQAARRILQDFRTGRLGRVALQFAPDVDKEDDDNFDVESRLERGVVDASAEIADRMAERERRREREAARRAREAVETAKRKGLELPPRRRDEDDDDDDGSDVVGKGMFDGW